MNPLLFFFQVKKKQEQLLKVRNFLPPQSQEPEIFLLEKLVNQAAEADQRLESVAKAQGQTSDGKPNFLSFFYIRFEWKRSSLSGIFLPGRIFISSRTSGFCVLE